MKSSPALFPACRSQRLHEATKLARALRRKRRQRGSALFLVVMVTTLLTAVGLYSMNNASLAERAVGNNAQGMKAVYQAEFAARTFASVLNNRAAVYAAKARDGSQTNCRSTYAAYVYNATLTAGQRKIPTHCFSQETSELFGGLQFAANVGSFADLPGDLSEDGSLESAYFVEITDVYEAGIPIAGHNLNSKLKYYRFTLAAEAQVRPILPADADPIAALNASSVQRVRGQGVFGPF